MSFKESKGELARLRAALAAGNTKDIELYLSKGHEIEPARMRGRPRIHRIRPFSHYSGAITGRSQPRCKAYGCRRHLRNDQEVGCSIGCLRAIQDQTAFLLNAIAVDADRLFDEGKIGPESPLFELVEGGELSTETIQEGAAAHRERLCSR